MLRLRLSTEARSAESTASMASGSEACLAIFSLPKGLRKPKKCWYDCTAGLAPKARQRYSHVKIILPHVKR